MPLFKAVYSGPMEIWIEAKSSFEAEMRLIRIMQDAEDGFRWDIEEVDEDEN